MLGSELILQDTVFKINGRPVAHGNQILGWTS